jgi:hypothetical protein
MQTCLLLSRTVQVPTLRCCCSVSHNNVHQSVCFLLCTNVCYIQTLKRVRKADYANQISAVLFAADADMLGKHAPAARAQLTTAADDAAAASDAVKRGADALEVSGH